MSVPRWTCTSLLYAWPPAMLHATWPQFYRHCGPALPKWCITSKAIYRGSVVPDPTTDIWLFCMWLVAQHGQSTVSGQPWNSWVRRAWTSRLKVRQRRGRCWVPLWGLLMDGLCCLWSEWHYLRPGSMKLNPSWAHNSNAESLTACQALISEGNSQTNFSWRHRECWQSAYISGHMIIWIGKWMGKLI